MIFQLENISSIFRHRISYLFFVLKKPRPTSIHSLPRCRGVHVCIMEPQRESTLYQHLDVPYKKPATALAVDSTGSFAALGGYAIHPSYCFRLFGSYYPRSNTYSPLYCIL